MSHENVRQAAEAWNRAADAITEACRLLESAGVAEERIEPLYQAANNLSAAVHQLHPPQSADERDAGLGPVFYTPATILANDAGPDAAGDLRASTAEEIRQHGVDYPIITGGRPE